MKNFGVLLFLMLSQFGFSQENHKDTFRNKGYFNITRIGYVSVSKIDQDVFIAGEGNFSFELDAPDARAYSLQTINGYFFGPYFSAGIGIGLDGYHEPNINTLPVFLDLRAYLSDNYNTPFLFLDWGTLLAASDTFQKGNLFNIGVGYKVFISKKKRIALTPEFGYSMKNISLTDESVRASDNTVNISGLHFALGITF